MTKYMHNFKPRDLNNSNFCCVKQLPTRRMELNIEAIINMLDIYIYTNRLPSLRHVHGMLELFFALKENRKKTQILKNIKDLPTA